MCLEEIGYRKKKKKSKNYLYQNHTFLKFNTAVLMNRRGDGQRAVGWEADYASRNTLSINVITTLS